MERRGRSGEFGDRIISEHWRLHNIELVHSFGKKITTKGFYSVEAHDGIPEKLVLETRDSSQTPFLPLILLVPPRSLGTHEATIGDPMNPRWVPPGRTQSGYAEIDLSKGWAGSPLAVAAFTRCDGDKVIDCAIHNALDGALKRRGGMGLLEEFGYGDLLTLDGHHRLDSAIRGPVRYKYVPVQLIPYLIDPCVVLKTWHADGKCWCGEQVFDCAKDPNKVADAKRTKFGITGRDGIIRRIWDAQPDIYIPLANLV